MHHYENKILFFITKRKNPKKKKKIVMKRFFFFDLSSQTIFHKRTTPAFVAAKVKSNDEIHLALSCLWALGENNFHFNFYHSFLHSLFSMRVFNL